MLALRLPVYLDHNATTPIDPEVLRAMAPYLTRRYGNASSRTHAFGHEARAGVETAREKVAAAIGAAPAEIVFTSGATESNNLALKGLAGRARGCLFIGAVEHPSVRDAALRLRLEGRELCELDVDSEGVVRLDAVEASLGQREPTLLSLMLVNNETGAVQPVREVAARVRARGAVVHCDAVQALGKLALNVDELGVDLLSISAHKVYGPKGVGALYVRQGTPLTPLFDGGGQEQALRSGTLNVAGIVGFGRAVELAGSRRDADQTTASALAQRFHARLSDLGGVLRTGPAEPARRVPQTLNLSFAGTESETLLLALADQVGCSSGSACASGSARPSHVLTAMGLDPRRIGSAIRFSLGRATTEAELDFAAEAIARVVRRLRR